MDTLTVKPLDGFCALDGCNCLTSSFRKVCVFNGYTVSEEMLLGLAALAQEENHIWRDLEIPVKSI